MKNSRRDFIKKASIGSAFVAGGFKLEESNGQTETEHQNVNTAAKPNLRLNTIKGENYTKHLQNNKVKWLPSSSCNWEKGRWISLKNNVKDPHPYFLARKEFELEETQSKAVVHISADLFYRLWVNGQFVDWGPPRDTQIVMAYRSFDISELLHPGVNVIAAEVYQNRYPVMIHRHLSGESYWGKNQVPAADQMALICQLDLKERSFFGSDKTWKVLPGEAWSPRAVRSSFFSQAEVYDAKNEPEGWKLAGFDDGNWQKPGDDPTPENFAKYSENKRPHTKLEASFVPPVNRNMILPAGIIALGEVSDLGRVLSRDIAQKMGYEHIQPMRDGKVGNADFLLRETGTPVIVENGHVFYDRQEYYRFLDERNDEPEIRDVTILLDFGEMINGHFLLELEPADAPKLDFMPGQQMFNSSAATINYGSVDFAWAQELVAGQVEPRVYATDPGSEGSGFDLGYAGRYIMKKGRQVWESFHYQQFRYVQLTFRDLNGPLKLHRFAAIRTQVPLPETGSFSCSDPLINWTWEATARSIPLCMHDNSMDNLIRERGLYTGECGLSYTASGLPLFGDNPFLKNFYRLFTEQLEDRRYLRMLLDVYQPVKENMPDILFHPVQTAYAMCGYFYHCTDEAFIHERIYPLLSSLSEYLFSMLNENNVFEDPPTWQYLDWADLDNNRGEVAPQSLYFAMLLFEIAKISSFLGKNQDAEKFTAKAEKIREYIYARFWNDEKGLYVDSRSDGKQNTFVFSEHTNCLALLNGLGKNGRDKSIVENLFRYDKKLVQSEVSFMLFVLKALFRNGYEVKALQLIRERYNRLYRRGYQTLPEEWSHRMSVRQSQWISRWRSVVQDAACVPAAIIFSEILGINPLAPQFRKIEIKPLVLLLEHASGVIPTPQGKVSVNWEKRDGEIYVSVGIPGDIEASILLPAGAEPISGTKITQADNGGKINKDMALFNAGEGQHLLKIRIN